MGLLKKKDILLADQFANHDDPFYADNQVLKTTSKNSLPGSGSDIMVAKSQAVFFTVDNILNKLLANDMFISQYLSKIRASGLSKDRAKDAFNQSYQIPPTTYFEERYQQHYDQHHDSMTSEMVPLSAVSKQFMHNDFSNFDAKGAAEHFNWKQYDALSSSFQMSADVLISCEFDDSANVKYPTNYVNVQVMNSHTGSKFSYSLAKDDPAAIAQQIPQTTDSKYIYKEWLSGLKELYIYIPTTFTFYNHDLLADGCSPYDKTTWIRVVLNGRHFKLKHIYNMQICGQSLPLQIDAASQHPDSPFFGDCPQPSVARTMCISEQLSSNVDCIYDSNTGMFTMYFCCYGTDAQAIQIFAD